MKRNLHNAQATALPAAVGASGVPSVHALSDDKGILDAFASYQQVRDSSRRTYKQCLRQFFSWVESTGRNLSAVGEQDVIAFKDNILESHSPLTARAYVIAVRKFYDWTERMGLYPNVARAVKSPRKQSTAGGERFQKMHLTADEASRLLEQYGSRPRDYAMVNLMLRTGLRSIEVSRARIQDVTVRSGRRILKVWGKGMDSVDPNVYVVLTDAAWEPVREYLETRGATTPGEPLFATEGRGSRGAVHGRGCRRAMTTRRIQMIVKDGLRAIGLDGHEYSTHSLRHTTGTELIRHGASILDVQRTLRHVSTDTSLIYVSSIQDEEHLRNAPEQLLDQAFGPVAARPDDTNQKTTRK